MENRSHAIIAAVFLIVLFFGSAAAAWWMQAGRAEVKQYKIISAHGVSGLQVQAPVNFKGIQVGTVRKVELYKKNPEKVLIVIGLINKVPVTQATYAQLSSNGITGVSSISLQQKKSGAPDLPTSKDNPARIPLRQGLLKQLEHSGKKIMSQAQTVTQRVQQVLSSQNQKHIEHTLAQLDSATRKLNELESRMMPVMQQLPVLMDSMRKTMDSAQKTMAEGPKLVREANVDAHRLHLLLNSANRLVNSVNQSTVPKINDLTDQLASTTRHVDELTKSLQNNPGELIYGGSNPSPGPGEPGYKAPQ